MKKSGESINSESFIAVEWIMCNHVISKKCTNVIELKI